VGPTLEVAPAPFGSQFAHQSMLARFALAAKSMLSSERFMHGVHRNTPWRAASYLARTFDVDVDR
jgi:hypothetical protein